MASGLEVLGALAAATQLAEQILSLVRFIQDTRDAPKEVVEHIASLQQLESVAESIKTNPAYRSQQIAEVLSLINAKVKAVVDILTKIRATATDNKATAIRKAVVTTWKDDSVTSRLDQIERDKATLTLCLTQIDAQVQNEHRQEQNEHIKNLTSQLQSLRRLQETSSLSEGQWSNYCLAELFITSPIDDRAMLIRTKGTRSAGTCTWVIEHPTFRAWQEPASTAPLLWISGGPGKGKTMISIFLTQELEKIALQQGATACHVVYFFCDNKDNKRNGASCVLRGLILQILTRYPVLVKYLLPEFKIQRSKLFEESSFDSLWRVFEDIIYHSPTKIIYCVVDGLDELHSDALDVLLQKFRTLAIPKFKAIGLSRHFPQIITEAFCHYPSIRLDPDSDKEVNRDVESYVHEMLKELSRVKQYPPDLERHVLETLQSRSEGTFLWISFAVNVLSQVSISETENCLESLPKGLDAIYGRVLLGIKKENSGLVANMLKWVTLAVTPMSLEGLGAALGLLSSNSLSLAEVIRDKIQLCRGLLVLDEDRVILVHQSLKDYLLEPDPDQVLEAYRIDYDAANFAIVERCFKFIETENPSEDLLEDLLILDVSTEKPFLDYAIIHWVDHALASSSFPQRGVKLFSTFFSGPSSVGKLWFKAYMAILGCIDYPRKDIWDKIFQSPNAAFVVATSLQFSSLARCLWHSPRLRDKFKGTLQRKSITNLGLCIAARTGNSEIAEFLLRQGANVNTIMKIWYGGAASPLGLAADSGHEATVKLLLSKNAKLEVKDVDGCTPLLNALYFSNSPGVMSMLINAGANVSVRSHNRSTPLHMASRNADKVTMELLLEAGASVHSVDLENRTPLHYLVIEKRLNGSNEVGAINLLLQYGSNLEARDRKGLTPLCHAAKRGHEAVVTMLLRQGANVHARNNTGKTPRDLVQDRLLEVRAQFEEAQKGNHWHGSHWVGTVFIDSEEDLSRATDCLNKIAEILKAAEEGHLPSEDTDQLDSGTTESTKPDEPNVTHIDGSVHIQPSPTPEEVPIR